MKKALALIAAVLTTLAAGCSVVTVRYDYHTRTDFSKYHSFQFMEQKEGSEQNGIMVDRIQDEVTAQLRPKGIGPNADHPDFLIAIYVHRKERVDTSACGYSYFAFGYYWRPYFYWGGPWGIDCPRYDEGKVILDFVDAENKKLIWRAVADEDLPYPENPATMQRYVRKAVTKMLKYFPPK